MSDSLDLFAWPDDPDHIGVVMEPSDRAELLTLSGLAHLIPETEAVNAAIADRLAALVLQGPPPCKCSHPEADHQKGGETSRSSLRFVPGVMGAGARAPFLGTNRYCHEPLCSCTHYRPKEADAAS